MATTELPGTDEQTNKLLVQVKKGKARKFAMIAKGANVLRLVVFRKGGFEAQVQAAKKEGFKGQGYWGVVNGCGPDMTFYLSTEDGFEKPPVKDMILKKFLLEEAQLKVKPTFELVTELPTVSEVDEDDEDATDTAVAEPETPAEEEPAAEPDDTEFKERLAALTPDLKKALATDSPVTEELKKYFGAVQKLAKARQFDKGMLALDKIEQLITQALAEPAAPTEPKAEEPPATPPPTEQKAAAPAAQPATPPPPSEPAAAPAEPAKPAAAEAPASPAEREARQKAIADAYRDFPDALKFTTLDAAAGKCGKLTPDQRDTVEALEAYQDLSSECVQWLRSEEAREHPEAVMMVEAMRDAAKAEQEATKKAIAEAAALKAKLAQEFKERLVALMPAIKEAQGPESPVAADVAKLFKQVQAQGKAKEFEAGHATLDEIETAIEQARAAAEEAAKAAEAAAKAAEEAAPAAEAAPMDDQSRTYQLCSRQWRQSRERLRQALRGVEEFILAPYVGDETFAEAKANTQAIYDILNSLDDRLCGVLDDAASNGSGKADEVTKKARSLVDEYTSFINGDPLLNALESDKEVPLGMKSELIATLKSISVQIG